MSIDSPNSSLPTSPASMPLPDLATAAPRLAASPSASHEIFTPMNGIMGMLDALMDSELAPWQRDCVNVARNCAENLLQSLTDILDYSTLASGKLALEATAFDLQDTVETALADCRPAATAKSLDLLLHYPSGTDKQLIGAPRRLRQIVASLVHQAIAYTAKDPVSVEIETLAQDGLCNISITVSTDANLPAAGAHPAEQEPPNSMQPLIDLAACGELLQLMGGSLLVQNEPGKPAALIISLRLPFAPSAFAARPDETALTGKGLVLTADASAQQSIVSACAQCALTVDSVLSVDGALTAIEQAVAIKAPYQFLVLDHQLPGIDAETLAAAIKASPVYQNLQLWYCVPRQIPAPMPIIRKLDLLHA